MVGRRRLRSKRKTQQKNPRQPHAEDAPIVLDQQAGQDRAPDRVPDRTPDRIPTAHNVWHFGPKYVRRRQLMPVTDSRLDETCQF